MPPAISGEMAYYPWMRLFHFSDDPGVRTFLPRPVRTPSARPPGREWLNGPLVWAIDDEHEMLYLFPRECPRIVVWPGAATSRSDREKWFGKTSFRAIAFVERRWLQELKATTIQRYEMPLEPFESLDDAGMWVSRVAVTPIGREALSRLNLELAARGVDLRVVDTLVPLRDVWRTSLHASGIRLRNAEGWPDV